MNVAQDFNSLKSEELAVQALQKDFIMIPLCEASIEPHERNTKEYLKELAKITGKRIFTGKEPKISGWQNLNLETHTEDDARRLFVNHKGNYGIVTGVNKLCVVDFDNMEVYHKFAEKFPEIIANTVVVKTGKGMHVYFRVDDGGFTGPARFDGEVLGDCRAKGGQVVCPPSIHIQGKRYEWINSLKGYEIHIIKSLIELGIEPAKKGITANKKETAAELLERACKAIIEAEDGTQNDAISFYAGRVFIEVVNGNLPQDEAYDALMKASIDGGHPAERTAATLESAMKYAQKTKTKQQGKHTSEWFALTGDKIYSRTDRGNAERIIDMFPGKLIFIPETGEFYAWDGKSWNSKNSGKSFLKMYDEMLECLLYEAINERHDKLKEEKFSWKLKSEWFSTMTSVKNHLRGMLSKNIQEMDTDDNLLNCQNGVLNLITLELLPHSPELYMTKIIRANFIPDKPADRWRKFIKDITMDNPELADYLQRIMGYCLTGRTDEKAMFFCYGDTGNNGKSTLLNAAGYILNDYCMKIMSDSLMVKKNGSNINNDLARLPGARFVIGSEISTGHRLNDGLLRDFVGNGDAITARFLHKEYFQFIPKFKLFMYGNTKPDIYSTDEAMRKKIEMIPFTYEAKNPDVTLKDVFAGEEMDGVFAWMVKGLEMYHARKLTNKPKCVIDETVGYFDENDFVHNFLSECCETGEGLFVSKAEFYSSYADWSEETNSFKLTKTKFGRAIKQKGFQDAKRDSGKNHVWLGLQLKKTV